MWAKGKTGEEGSTAQDEKYKRNTYLQQVVKETDISTLEASSSKFDWMLEKLRTTTSERVLIFSSW